MPPRQSSQPAGRKTMLADRNGGERRRQGGNARPRQGADEVQRQVQRRVGHRLRACRPAPGVAASRQPRAQRRLGPQRQEQAGGIAIAHGRDRRAGPAAGAGRLRVIDLPTPCLGRTKMPAALDRPPGTFFRGTHPQETGHDKADFAHSILATRRAGARRRRRGAFAPPPSQAQETFKLGIVSFLSGQAAESFGIPAVNGAKVLVDAFNKGAAPAPYNKVGFGGMKIEPVYVDENGGATKQVQELRNLYDREKVDAVVGYVGSGDCLAVAPVAEEMKQFLILYDCGTPRIFEDNKYKYVFRTASHAAMDNVALARYLKARNVKVESFNLINQDYAWGQDSKKDFVLVDGEALPRLPSRARTSCRSSAPASTAPRSRR